MILGLLAGVSDSSSEYLTGVSFNSRGLLSQLNLGNGNHETFSYNDRIQMTSQSLLKSSTVMQKYDYSYGTGDLSNGTVDTTKNNQLSKVEAFIGSDKQWSQGFGYDELGRLKEAREYRGRTDNYFSYKQVFDFDRFGNLYCKATNNGAGSQEDPLNYTPIEAQKDGAKFIRMRDLKKLDVAINGYESDCPFGRHSSGGRHTFSVRNSN